MKMIYSSYKITKSIKIIILIFSKIKQKIFKLLFFLLIKRNSNKEVLKLR